MIAEVLEPIKTKRGVLSPGQLVDLPDAIVTRLDRKVRPVLPGGLTLSDLEAKYGSDPDWPKIKNDLSLLRGYAKVLATTRQIRAGIIPKGWTSVFKCARCGLVYLEPGGPYHLQACPWCFNREKGLPIPHPKAEREPTRTADQLTPEERSRWCMEHELRQSNSTCPFKNDLTRCVLWRAIREKWPVSRLSVSLTKVLEDNGHHN